MPIYEYECSDCGHKLEELQTMSEPPLVKCPNCGKDTLKRLIGGGAGLIFKGSGFYLTDYKKSSDKKSSEKSESSKEHSTKTEKKTEPKPDTKTTQTETKPSAKQENKKK
jgi:putative FmdB family regulatory protein